MRVTRHFLAVAFLFASPAFIPASDLKEIERRLLKEPAYQSKRPAYCLVAFGPKAATRVWLVLDGQDLYVDRNGNGDLTEPGEKIEARVEKVGVTSSFGDFFEDELSFEIGDVLEADRLVKHRDLRLKTSGGHSRLTIRSAGNWEQYSSNQLAFAKAPRDAPVVHFHGPRRLGLVGPAAFVLTTDGQLAVDISTAGLGPDSFAMYYNLSIPPEVHPQAEVTFPAPPGVRPVTVRLALNKRC